mgnify:CR=1 FL=1
MQTQSQIFTIHSGAKSRELEALASERALLDQKLETWRDLMSAADDGMHGDINIDPERITARLDAVEARIAMLRRRLH